MCEINHNLVLHVVGATCDFLALVSKPRFGKFSNDTVVTRANSRRAAKPENFTKAGFFFWSVPNVWGRLAYIRRAKAPGTRQDITGEGGRRLEPVGSAGNCAKSGQKHLRRNGSIGNVKRSCDLHGNGFACSEIHHREYKHVQEV